MEPPVKLQCLVELTSLGVDPNNINFQKVTLQSDKFVCVREPSPTDPTASSLVIVDMSQPNQPKRTGIKGDSAIMHPKGNILALKSSTDAQKLQVIDIAGRKLVKEHQMPQPVSFWKWISDTTIAIVSQTAVFHWGIEDESAPRKVFDRAPELSDHQVINYHVNGNGQWMVLVGIAPRDGRVVGNMQLYSVERKISQTIPGHAAAFTEMTLPGQTQPSTFICFASRNDPAAAKFYVFEVGKKDTVRKATDIFFAPNDAADFPLAIVVSPKTQLAYMITKQGTLYIYELSTAKLVFMTKFSQTVVFTACLHESADGALAVNLKGQLLSVAVNPATIVPYIVNTLQDFELAKAVASRGNFPGGEDLFRRQFEALFRAGQYDQAVVVAVEAPALRTKQTIQMFQSLPTVPGKQPFIMQYFLMLLERGKLNKTEAVELARPVLQQGRKDLVEKWINEDKFEASEELGDLCRTADPKLALSVYVRAGAQDKVILLLAETGQFVALVKYAQQKNYTPDYMALLTALVASNPPGAAEFAKVLMLNESGSLVDKAAVLDLFINKGKIQEISTIMMDVMTGDKPEDGALQTRLLEVNLSYNPAAADFILGRGMFTRFNTKHIAELCESKALYLRALELFDDARDARRVIQQHGDTIDNSQFWVDYFARWVNNPTEMLDLLRDLLKNNLAKNLTNAVLVAQKYTAPDKLNPNVVIKLFEEVNSNEGKFMYLQGIVSFTQDPEIVYNYIESAAKSGQIKEVERVVHENNSYDGARVRDFLMEARLPDQMPLIIVCNKFNFVNELTNYLYRNGMKQYIEAYVQNFPVNTPAVVGALLDNEANEDFIRGLLQTVGGLCSVELLVDEVEKRNKLKILQGWLEKRVSEGNKEPATHNALAKIYIDTQRDAEAYLTTNMFYDSKVVGKYCESRNPKLAVVAYKRGFCHHELIEVTNANGYYTLQAKYLVELQNFELWQQALSNDNTHRDAVVDAVINTAIPETKNTDQIKATLKAFGHIPDKLLLLLEKIVLGNSEFGKFPKLQNLLIVTAVRSEPTKVMDYITRLDSYDGIEIADVALGAGLNEEAFFIYRKMGENVKAINVLLTKVQDVERATDFAEQTKQPEVFTELAKAELAIGKVKESIDAYIKAQEPNNYNAVIEAAKKADLYDDLVRYLQMARKKAREWKIETELAYSLAKIGKLNELTDFISGPNYARIQDVGDRCFEEGLFEAARILFSNNNNHSRLAATLVKLKQFAAAVEAARKDGAISTWKNVCKACIEAKEFKLAHQAGLHVIVQADELEDLIRFYERRGYFNDMLELLEDGLHQENAHPSLKTELAILYSKYSPQKLMKHIQAYHDTITIPKVASVVDKNQQWSELCFLYTKYGEFDKAINCMIKHSADAWDHITFKETILRVSNIDLYDEGLKFYATEQPTLVNDYLKTIAAVVENRRVVSTAKKNGYLSLIKSYLEFAQEKNVQEINDALNELYIEEEDFDALRKSVDLHDNFDSLSLAKKLKTNELLEFRRISAHLYRRNGHWAEALEISKADKLDEESVKTAAESNNTEIAEDLLRYFVQTKNSHSFAAALFTCYDLVRPDVVLELAWESKMMDFAMPYMIQFVREYTTKVDKLEKALQFQQQPMMVVPTMTGAPFASQQGVAMQQLFATNPNPGIPPQMTGQPMPPQMVNQQFGQFQGAPNQFFHQ